MSFGLNLSSRQHFTHTLQESQRHIHTMNAAEYISIIQSMDTINTFYITTSMY